MALDFRLDPSETGLVVVDVQNGFCHPEGSRGRVYGPHAVELPRGIVPNVVRLVRACREAGVPIWFTRQVYYPDDRARQRRRIPAHLDRRGVRLDLCFRGSWDAELVDEVAAEVRPEDEVLMKHRASAFYNTPFESELRAKGVQVLIVSGVTSSFCVESTIRDAYMRDLDVLVPADCIADSDPAAQESVLKNVRRFFGVVTSLNEVAGALRAAGAPARPAAS